MGAPFRSAFPLFTRSLARPAPQTRPPRTLDAELEAVLLSKAAQFGLPGEWVSRLDALDPERRQVLRVRSCVADSPAAAVLASGDMILQINGRPVTCFGDVDEALAGGASGGAGAAAKGGAPDGAAPAAKRARRGGGGGRKAAAGRRTKQQQQHQQQQQQQQEKDQDQEEEEQEEQQGQKGHEGAAAAAAENGGGATANGVHPPAAKQQASGGGGDDGAALPEVTLTIFDKSKAVRDVRVRLQQECGMGTSRLIHWAGAQLQAPHRAVRELGFLPPGGAGVYISRCGAPCARAGAPASPGLEGWPARACQQAGQALGTSPCAPPPRLFLALRPPPRPPGGTTARRRTATGCTRYTASWRSTARRRPTWTRSSRRSRR
jgi:hypothetical protein